MGGKVERAKAVGGVDLSRGLVSGRKKGEEDERLSLALGTQACHYGSSSFVKVCPCTRQSFTSGPVSKFDLRSSHPPLEL